MCFFLTAFHYPDEQSVYDPVFQHARRRSHLRSLQGWLDTYLMPVLLFNSILYRYKSLWASGWTRPLYSHASQPGSKQWIHSPSVPRQSIPCCHCGLGAFTVGQQLRPHATPRLEVWLDADPGRTSQDRVAPTSHWDLEGEGRAARVCSAGERSWWVGLWQRENRLSWI